MHHSTADLYRKLLDTEARIVPRAAVVVAVDPGHVQSAYVVMEGGTVPRVLEHGLVPNADLVDLLMAGSLGGTVLAVEQIQGMGMAVGAEVFETCVWTGRFVQAWAPEPYVRIPRRWVKQHLCGLDRAKDANIRVAILDRFGGAAARGTKAAPGPLYGVKADIWSAVAVGLTYLESSDSFTENGRLAVVAPP